MAFHDPTLVRLGAIFAARATAIEAEVERIAHLIEPARAAALQEIATQLRELARELSDGP